MPQVILDNTNRSIDTLIVFAKDVEVDGKGHHKLHAQPLANGNVHLYTSKEGFSLSHRLAGTNPNPARRELAENVINKILARTDKAAFVPLGWGREEGETLRAAELKQVFSAGNLAARLPPIAHLFDDEHADVLASFRNFLELGGIENGKCMTELDFLAQLHGLRRLPLSNPVAIIDEAVSLTNFAMRDTSALPIKQQALPKNHMLNINGNTKVDFKKAMEKAEAQTNLPKQAEMMLGAFTISKGKVQPSLEDALLAMVGGAYDAFVKQASPPPPQPMQLGEIQDMLKQAARERQVQAEAPRVEAASEWETVKSDSDSSKSIESAHQDDFGSTSSEASAPSGASESTKPRSEMRPMDGGSSNESSSQD